MVDTIHSYQYNYILVIKHMGNHVDAAIPANMGSLNDAKW